MLSARSPASGRRRHRQPVAGPRGLDGRRRAAEPPPRDHQHPLPRRPDRVRPRAHLPRHRARARARRGAGERRVDLAAAAVLDPAAVAAPRPRAGRVHRPERPRLRRLPAGARRLVLDPPHAAGPPPARGGRGAGGGRCAGRQRVRDPLPLRVRRRDARRPRRGDDHAGHPARLVRGADRQRAGLDRGRPRHLRPVVTVPGRGRGLPVRRHRAAHAGDCSGRRRSSGIPNPFFTYHPTRSSWTCCRTLLVLVRSSWGRATAMRKRIGAPAALGIPYVRGERGR